jgi:hypothetical protein
MPVEREGWMQGAACCMQLVSNPKWQNTENCASCWSKDPVTEDAWLCVAGSDAIIKVYNVIKGTLVKVGLHAWEPNH